jgi:hypothetical protein
MTHAHPLDHAADLVGVAGLLQIAAELGVDQALDSGDTFTADDLARLADVPHGIQVVSRINATFGVDLTLRAIFDEPTIAALAAEIEKRQLADS